MDLFHRALLRCGLALLCGLMMTGDAGAQRIDPSASKLMVVLREWNGGNKQDEALRPVGKVTSTFDGKDLTMELAWFTFLGDMNVVFVFDEPHSFKHVTAEEFIWLHLSAEEAVERAVANIKRVYGAPRVVPYQSGVMQVVGASPDLDSSFFLDRNFWRSLAARHPEGLVVCVPRRGGLVFTPASDEEAVDALRDNITYLHRTGEKLRISSALYLFKDDRWTVFQPPAEAQ
jgi:uncharacterized protein YtpQ (UPF0354 family)